MPHLDEKTIIHRIKQGYIDDFEFIVQKYGDVITRLVKRKLFDKDDVDDVVQTIFLKFYKAIPRFDERRPVLPYLYEITKNELKMYFRSKKFHVSLDDVNELTTATQIDGTASYGIEKVMSALSAAEQNALQLLSTGYSYQEIALHFKKNINTIKTLVHRARGKMKQILNEKNT